ARRRFARRRGAPSHSESGRARAPSLLPFGITAPTASEVVDTAADGFDAKGQVVGQWALHACQAKAVPTDHRLEGDGIGPVATVPVGRRAACRRIKRPTDQASGRGNAAVHLYCEDPALATTLSRYIQSRSLAVLTQSGGQHAHGIAALGGTR